MARRDRLLIGQAGRQQTARLARREERPHLENANTITDLVTGDTFPTAVTTPTKSIPNRTKYHRESSNARSKRRRS